MHLGPWQYLVGNETLVVELPLRDDCIIDLWPVIIFSKKFFYLAFPRRGFNGLMLEQNQIFF